jgi:hypothetical protein
VEILPQYGEWCTSKGNGEWYFFTILPLLLLIDKNQFQADKKRQQPEAIAFL